MKLTIHANIASLLQDLVYLNQAWLMQKKVAHNELAKMLVLVGSSEHNLDTGPKLQTHMHASNIMHVYAYILCGHMCCLSCVCQVLINAIYKHTCKQTIIQASLQMHIYMYISFVCICFPCFLTIFNAFHGNSLFLSIIFFIVIVCFS